MIKLNDLHAELSLKHAAGQSQRIKVENMNDIAVIGLSVHLPLANDSEEFWNNIVGGNNSVRKFPGVRKEQIDHYLAFLQKNPDDYRYLDAAYLERVDTFDYQFFRLSPKETNYISPDQRLFLQCAWEAIENAGYGGQALQGSRTGVFVGYVGEAGGYKYRQMIVDTDHQHGAIGIPGNLASIIPSRLSYLLDLKGPSMVIDTACSSSLVAVHQACKAIRDHECEMAIVGGVRTDLIPLFLEVEQLGTESSDGMTRTYDENADGSGLGEGTGAVVLKSLSQAIQDGDHIYAVIKGSAINQDGLSMGITAPNADAQADVLAQAWRQAGVDPETISYLEAHGTGTPLGDAIEIQGIRKAFERFTTKKQFCAIGSVKTNIGHLYQSAGIVGLIKATLALHYKKIPPSIHFHTPNAKLNLIDSPVYVNTKLRNWVRNETVRRAGVSSFGLSGTNCHMVLEEAPYTPVDSKEKQTTQQNFLTISAYSLSQVTELLHQYYDYLRMNQSDNLADICFTTNVGRGHYTHRLAMICKSMEDLLVKLEVLLREGLSTPMDDVFYGAFKIVPEDKGGTFEGELTESVRRQLSMQAQEIVAARDAIHSDLLHKLGRLYVQGADVPWLKWYRGENRKRVVLPTYPFARESCWLEIPELEPRFEEKKKQFYALGWQEEDFSNITHPITSGTVLLLRDQKGIGRSLTNELRTQGCRVIEVCVGEENKQLHSDLYMIRGSEADYKGLVQQLQKENVTLILQLLSINENGIIADLEQLQKSQFDGVYSLFYLLRALLEVNFHHTMEIVLISEYVHEVTGQEKVLYPQNAPLFGLGKVIGKEHPELTCRGIDIDDTTSIEEIVLALRTTDSLYQVALREGKRYVEVFDEVDLERVPTRKLDLLSEGVYVITGGLGGMGLEVAKYLASRTRVKLALINRTKLPERHQWNDLSAEMPDEKARNNIRAIQQLESMGADVTCYSADVASFEQMERVMDNIHDRFGNINGIVHCAGIAGNGFLIRKEEQVFQNVLRPKIYGTWILDYLTRNDDLQFFVNFSSAAALLGEPGQGDYTAANSYLDAFAAARKKQGKHTLAINWVVWKEVGMGVQSGFNREGLLFHLLTNAQAMSAFDQVMKRDISHVLIGEMNYASEMVEMLESRPFYLSPTIESKLAEQQKTAVVIDKFTRSASETVHLIGKESAVYTDVEKQIAEVCRDILGFKEINVYDSFFELGADSLLLKRMHAELDQKYPGLLTVTDLFAHTSVLKLANHIERVTGGAGDPETEALEQLLDDVGSGSISLEDALKSLLGD